MNGVGFVPYSALAGCRRCGLRSFCVDGRRVYACPESDEAESPGGNSKRVKSCIDSGYVMDL